VTFPHDDGPPADACAVRIETLGCKVNQADSETLAAQLLGHGYRIARPGESAAVIIVNTCTVTHVADAKARKLIRRLARANPQAALIVTGCYAERAPAELAQIPGVARIVPNRSKADLLRIARQLAPPQGLPRAATGSVFAAGPRPARPGSVRAFVAAQDGCDHHCSYCIVPDVRGPMRSRPIADVLAEMRALAAAGAHEVIICGIRLGAYGEEPAGRGLARLLRATRDLPMARVRLSSIEPWDVGEELIAEIVAHPLLCPHLHLPLQSGDDDILRAMSRPYTFHDYRRLVQRVREAAPDIAITTDLMVGFPGESERAFENTLHAVDAIGFARAHVFRYSRRPETRAAVMPEQVPESVKAARAARLIKAAQASARRFAQRFVGRKVTVLFEECVRGTCSGLTDAYLPAKAPGDPSLIGRVAGVDALAVESSYIAGRLAQPGPVDRLSARGRKPIVRSR
jgi:threonylcarbamoyladenosine tRNA methylthiotransferase MtaB